jgi:hypothetical protein
MELLSRKIYPVLFAIILTFVFSINGIAQKERYITPVDEGKNDASFNKFRENFIAAVKRRDVKFLLDTLDRDVKGSFGGHDGISDFRRLWKLDKPNSLLWNELLIVLTNGGNFVKEAGIKNKQFCAPYSFTMFPSDLDGFEYQMIFGNNVNLRARPDLKAETIAQLSYNVVRVDYENSVADKKREGEYAWLKIETLGGKKGFVSADFVRSPIDYRGCFEKINGKWKMTFFLAGD